MLGRGNCSGVLCDECPCRVLERCCKRNEDGFVSAIAARSFRKKAKRILKDYIKE